MSKLIVVYHSTYGHTKLQAKAVHRGASSVKGIKAEIITTAKAIEQIDNFDSWHQEDSRQLQRKIALSILEEYNFQSIVDVGSGKGALTHLLKKRNNQVIGLDISSTAVEQQKQDFQIFNSSQLM